MQVTLIFKHDTVCRCISLTFIIWPLSNVLSDILIQCEWLHTFINLEGVSIMITLYLINSLKTRMVNMFLCRMQHLSMKCISLKYIVTANIFLLDTKRNQNITFSLNKNNVDNNRTKQSQIYSQFVFSLEKYADSGQTKFVESIHCF